MIAAAAVTATETEILIASQTARKTSVAAAETAKKEEELEHEDDIPV